MCNAGDWIILFLAGSLSFVLLIIGLCVAYYIGSRKKEETKEWRWNEME